MNAVAKVVKFESLAEIKEPQDSKVRMTENGYFEMPNSVVDDLAIMPDSTWKIYGIMIRKTYGWGKETDCLATSQLMELSGQSNKTVVKSCSQLEQAGLIEVIGFAAQGTKVYRVANLTCEKITHAMEYFHSLCKKYTSSYVNSTQPAMENLHTQKKTPQKKIKESISTGSLPHRQLRNDTTRPLSSSCSSLPHRQLRKTSLIKTMSCPSSLPHRQLRKIR